jgi:hypothetical protein
VSDRKVIVRRVPFFRSGGEWFADVLWNFGYPLAVDLDRLVRVLATAPPSTFVVGRRLDARKSRMMDERRGDFEHEAFGYLFPREHDRWG